jgi:hypothetical protein
MTVLSLVETMATAATVGTLATTERSAARFEELILK